MIEDEETCNMLFNSNYFGACLNKLCTVILLGGFGNTESFSQNIENSPEDANRWFCTKSVHRKYKTVIGSDI